MGIASGLTPWCVIALALSASISRADPEIDPNAARAAFLSDGRKAVEEVGQGANAISNRPLSSLAKLQVVQDHLEWRLLVNDLPDDVVLPLPGGALRISTNDLGGDPAMRLASVNAAWIDEQACQVRHVQLLPQPLGMTIAFVLEDLNGSTDVQFLTTDRSMVPADEGPEPAKFSLYVTRSPEAGDAVRSTLDGTTFGSLIELHHAQARSALFEALITLHSVSVLAGVSEPDAIVMLAGAQPVDSATTDRVSAILAGLKQSGAGAIPALRAKLRALGPIGIRTFEHLPREGWSPDLTLNADTLLAGLMPAAPRSLSLLNSKPRLFELLYSQDISLRRSALDRLQTLVGSPVKDDPSVDPYANIDQLEAERRRVAGD